MPKPGEIFDPKKDKTASVKAEPKILGAPTISQEGPKVLDKGSPQTQQNVEIHHHGETVTVREHVRSKPRAKDEPEVRIRTQTREERKSWDRAKRGD